MSTMPMPATAPLTAHGFIEAPASLLPVGLGSSLPPLHIAVKSIVDHVAAEEREDIEVPLASALRLGTADGYAVVTGDKPRRFAVERNGLRSMLARIGIFPRAFSVMEKAFPERRAKFFNGMMRDFVDETQHPTVLRTRLSSDGQRSIYAVVSPTYARCDSDEVMSHVGSILGVTGARGRSFYDAESTAAWVQALWVAPNAPDTGDVAPGVPAMIGLHVNTRDDTGGSVWVHGYYAFGSVTLPGAAASTPLALRFPSSDAGLVYRRAHRGDVGVFAGKLLRHSRVVRDAVADVIASWEAMADVTATEALPAAVKAATAAAVQLHGAGAVPTEDAVNLAVLAQVAKIAAPNDKTFGTKLVAAYEAQGLPPMQALTLGAVVKTVALAAIYGDVEAAEVGAGRVLVSLSSKYGKVS